MVDKKWQIISVLGLITWFNCQWIVALPAGPLSEEALRFEGDLRLRLQVENQDSKTYRLRNRYRVRLNGGKWVNPGTRVQLGLASGGTDPRSTNQTAQNSFETPDIRLDHAFVDVKPKPATTFRAGRLHSLFWNVSDIFFDTDLRPEGVELQTKKGTDRLGQVLTVGAYVLDEFSSSADDPMMGGIQAKMNWKTSKKMKIEAATSFYASFNTAGLALDHSSETNTLSNGGLTNDYRPVIIGIKATKKLRKRRTISLKAEYGVNTSFSADHQAIFGGIRLSKTKTNHQKNGYAEVNYRYIQKDAWLDIFPDSDAYFGQTDVQGLEFKAGFDVLKNVRFGIDLYWMDPIKRDSDSLFLSQFDLSFKF